MREVPLEGFETGAWLPYHMVTILNFSEETTMDGMDGTDGHMEFWDFLGPMNQLILQKAINFTGFSLSNHSCAIAQHRWRSRGSCDKAYDSGTYFDGPSTPMFLWRGDWPWWPLCEKDVGGASQAIPKRIVSQSCRLIFFAGVEGTGHHFWHSLLPHLHPFTTWSENFSAQLYDNYHKVGFFSTWDESVRSNHSIRIKQLMADADRSIREQGGGILPLNVLSEGTSGMMSYPNLFGVDRALQYPNVHALAKLAEDAGVDLRIVLLVRHPGSIVRSGLKRHFEKTQMHAIKMYTLALALLSAQLSLLDPSFFACWRYEAPTVGISDLLQFMGSREDPDDFKQVVAKESRQGANEIGATPAALQTATALHNAMLSKYCNASLADDNVSSQKLPKRIVSQSCRFPFFAGIEGTGHHFWHSLLPYLHPFKNWSGNLSAELYSGDHKTGFFSTWDESVRSNHSIRIKQVMADADRSIREQGGGIVPLNVLNERVSGMMSYPNFLGRTRALQNPDVPALAKLAEDAGVDLRIVLLLRHPRSVVRSGMRRGYEKSGLIHAISMYTATLSLLSTHLSLLDPSFIACWRYEAPNVGISDLLSFMGSQEDPGDFKQIIAKYYRGGKKHASSGEKLADEALQTATALHNALIAKYCKPRSAHARP